MPSLFVIQGQDQGKRFDLDRICTTIGRDTVNHIRLNDSEASRQHAEIRQDDLSESYYLTDLGSSNGTYINGKLIERQILQSGDRVQFGGTLLIYTGPDVGASDVSEPEDVDIVAEEQESQIISSLPHDENSQFFYGDGTDQESPWLARARSNLQVMYRTALAVSHTLDIDELLERIMGLIFEWVEADRGCILLKDRITDELVARARQSRPGVKPEGKLTISKTILDYVMSKSEGVLTSNARGDERFDEAGSIVKAGVREAIGVPMQGRYGVVGVIYIDTFTPPGDWANGNSNKFNEEHLKMMIAIAHQAALAVEDTAYYSAMLQSERLAAIGQTITGLSHHVKNILQGIRGGSYLIEEGLKATETDLVRTGWGIVEKNQEKISRLVLDMLTFSKEREPEISDADLHATVSDVVELMESRANECGVALEFEPDPAVPILRFDSEGIHHALLNVVTNAIDACESAWHNQVLVEDGGLVVVEGEEDLKMPSVAKSGDVEDQDEEDSGEHHDGEHQEHHDGEYQEHHDGEHQEHHDGEHQEHHDGEHQEHHDGEHQEHHDGEHQEHHDGEHQEHHDGEHQEHHDGEHQEHHDGEHQEHHDGEHQEHHDGEHQEHHDGEHHDEDHQDQDDSESKDLAAESDSDAGDADSEDGQHGEDGNEIDADGDDDDEEYVLDEEGLIILDDESIEPGSRGTVKISTHYLEEERRVELRVKDDGEGIEEDDFRQIFTVFNSTKGNQGTGLGLSVSQKILHEHGGDIRVTSRRGEGSTFTLVLPAVLPSEDQSENKSEVDLEMTDDGNAKDGTAAAHDVS